jgi:CSLREA domain-containing protein
MHHRLHILLLISMFGLCVPSIAPTYANSTLTVTSAADAMDAVPGDGRCATAASPVCTLRAAIQEANARPGADLIMLPRGTYTLTRAGSNEQAAALGDLDILDDLTITGAGATSTTIDANAIDRVFEVIGQTTVHLAGLTIQGGNPGNTPGYTHGGAIMNTGMLTIDASSIQRNTAQYGAGIYTEGGSVTLNGSTIEQNAAYGFGGGISSSGAVTLIESTLRGNRAPSGGGFYNYGTLVVRNSSVVSNTAESNGGGIANFMTMTIVNSRISGNTAGSGIHNPAANGTTLIASRVTNNISGDQGGGICNNGNMLQISESAIVGNTAGGDGGGVWVAGTVRLERSTVAGNRAATGGGFANLTSLELIDSTIADNQATTGGGVANLQGA